MKQTRSQIAIEFIFMIGMALILMLIFLTVIYTLTGEKQDAARDERFNDLGQSIARELQLAQTVHEGYVRTIVIPPADLNQTFASDDYTLALDETYLTIATGAQTYTFKVPNTTGTLVIGANSVHNIDGKVMVNP